MLYIISFFLLFAADCESKLKTPIGFVLFVLAWQVSKSVPCGRFTAKFVVSPCAFCKLRGNFGFYCSVNHLNWAGVKLMQITRQRTPQLRPQKQN